MTVPRYWIGVASKDYVLKAIEKDFCQLCHGKANFLKRLTPGDWITYYSPRTARDCGEFVQAFTAIGQILEQESYPFEMENGFIPYRRDVRFVAAQAAPIRPLLNELSFIKNKQSWGQVFRFGLVEIPECDFERIATAMNVEALTTQ